MTKISKKLNFRQFKIICLENIPYVALLLDMVLLTVSFAYLLPHTKVLDQIYYLIHQQSHLNLGLKWHHGPFKITLL
ncbi:hypothetical protein ACQ7EN_05460, partial [Leuconostoc lactis]|uniref:hypothetical protein n=1 Tax=Leuconostoc lactis TaxID=1246 RepID=UPI003D6A33B4